MEEGQEVEDIKDVVVGGGAVDQSRLHHQTVQERSAHVLCDEEQVVPQTHEAVDEARDWLPGDDDDGHDPR